MWNPLDQPACFFNTCREGGLINDQHIEAALTLRSNGQTAPSTKVRCGFGSWRNDLFHLLGILESTGENLLRRRQVKSEAKRGEASPALARGAALLGYESSRSLGM